MHTIGNKTELRCCYNDKCGRLMVPKHYVVKCFLKKRDLKKNLPTISKLYISYFFNSFLYNNMF